MIYKNYSFGITTLILHNLIALAAPAFADTKSLNFILSAEDNQTYKSLLQQAELLSNQVIEEGFAESADPTEITVTIIGERKGQEVPLLFTKVSRYQWKQQPQVKIWSQYFSNSATLLGFYGTPGIPVANSSVNTNYSPRSSSIENDPAFRDD